MIYLAPGYCASPRLTNCCNLKKVAFKWLKIPFYEWEMCEMCNSLISSDFKHSFIIQKKHFWNEIYIWKWFCYTTQNSKNNSLKFSWKCSTKTELDARKSLIWKGLGEQTIYDELVLREPNKNLLVNIERSDDFRKRQILSDGPRHAHLINRQIGIGRNDGSSGKIDTFTHQIATNPAFFAFQSLFYGFQRATRLLSGLENIWCLW